MGVAPSLRCQLCSGRAKLLESRPHKTGPGRRRRYGCQEPDCGFRWSEYVGVRSSRSMGQAERASGAVPGASLLQCSACGHWLDRCGLGFPEAVGDHTFASICPAFLGDTP